MIMMIIVTGCGHLAMDLASSLQTIYSWLYFHSIHAIRFTQEVSLEEQTNNEKGTDYKQNKGKYSSKPLSPIFS